MATKVQNAPHMNGTARKATAPRAAIKRPAPSQISKGPAKSAAQKAQPVTNKAASVAGGEGPGVTGAYAIMANRIANRVAEMAESFTFVEKPRAKEPELMTAEEQKRRPRKLEMRLNGGSPDSVAFSAPFLDNTLQKMLKLQNRMLKSSAELSKMEGVDEKALKEQAAQAAELSRIIALICAEKARQGA